MSSYIHLVPIDSSDASVIHEAESLRNEVLQQLDRPYAVKFYWEPDEVKMIRDYVKQIDNPDQIKQFTNGDIAAVIELVRQWILEGDDGYSK